MANYLYNGVELPDINEVWTDEVKAEYPFAHIIYYTNLDIYTLRCHKEAISYTAYKETLKCPALLGIGNYIAYDAKGNVWEFYKEDEITGGIGLTVTRLVWSSHDVPNVDDNSVYLAASDPIPVPTFTPDPISLTLGWIVGRRIAGQRGKKLPEPDAPDVPEVVLPEIVSWADGTDEQIAAMVAALDAGTISIEDTGWAIGDERKVTLSAMAATGVSESHVEQTVTLVLMDSQHYTLTEPTAGGDTMDHFVVGMKNMLANGTTREAGYMNSSNTNSGSWSGCARRAWCNDVFRAAIPEALRGCFKQFKVPTATTYNGSSVAETNDYFALFAEKEIFGSRTYSTTTEANALSQIKWYETAANRIKKAGDAGSASYWWGRSPSSGGSSFFCRVFSDGTADYDGAASYGSGLAPFGCI